MCQLRKITSNLIVEAGVPHGKEIKMHSKAERRCKDGNVEDLREQLVMQEDSRFGKLQRGFSYNTDYRNLLCQNKGAGKENADGFGKKG